MGYISDKLEAYTAENSNFDTSRDYISISHCALSVEEIVDQWNAGFVDTRDIRLRCYKGYQMERDLKTRMQIVFGNRVETGHIELSAFDGLVKGHPDFNFDGFPSDCKTVQIDDHLPNGRIPRKVYWQMQGYMLYSNKHKALVIYESRGSGKILDFWIDANLKIQEEIHDKFVQVVKIIRNEQS